MGQASLLDERGVERLIYLRDSNLKPYDGRIPIHLMLRSSTYDLRARATLGFDNLHPSELLKIAARADGDASYELWGLGDYRPEGPLLVMAFTGDKLGHLRVNVAMAEASLRMSDEFQTDQTCLTSFLNQLSAIEGLADA